MGKMLQRSIPANAALNSSESLPVETNEGEMLKRGIVDNTASKNSDAQVKKGKGKMLQRSIPDNATLNNLESMPVETDQVSHVKVLLAKYEKLWSEKVDKAVKSFGTDLNLGSAQFDTCLVNLSASLKAIQKEQSADFLVELSLLQRLHQTGDVIRTNRKKVALLYDEDMLLHTPPFDGFQEIPARLEAIMEKLKNENILNRCDLLEFSEASEKNLLAVHSATHVKKMQTISSRVEMERGTKGRSNTPTDDLYYSEGSTRAALLAAGGVLKACEVVANGLYQYAFAVVRPPGHHASRTKPAGFCLLNNIAVGAAHLLKYHRMGKILIIDFDIHHRDGTEKIFCDDARVLTFSVHRNDLLTPPNFSDLFHVRCGALYKILIGRQDKEFYPGSGSAEYIGKGSGKGFNVNVCWDHPEIQDVDYIAVWDHILIPLIKEFNPDIILISAGFDAAKGDPLGCCSVTQNGFATLLYKLKPFGCIVLALEGGYNLQALSDGVAACMKVLLGDDSSATSDCSGILPYDSTWQTILRTRKVLSPYWVAFESKITEEITSKSTKYITNAEKN